MRGYIGYERYDRYYKNVSGDKRSKTMEGHETLSSERKKWDFPTIYKLDSKGEVRVWGAYIINNTDDHLSKAYSFAGLEDMPKHTEKDIATTTNSTSYERAKKLYYTKLVNKLRKGYFRTREEALSKDKPLICMLAKDLDPADIQKLPDDYFPCWMQLKLNGIRGTYYRSANKIMSRSLKEFDKLTDLREECKALLNKMETERGVSYDYLDFELYAPGFPINEIVSMVRHGDDRIQAWVFDVPDQRGECSMHDRVMDMKELHRLSITEYIKYVTTMVAKDPEELLKFYEKVKFAGGEGIIIRKWDGKYKWNNKTTRDETLYKVKPLISEEFKVVDIYAEERIHEGREYRLATFICKTADGKHEFKVPPTSWGLEKRSKAFEEYNCIDNQEEADAYIYQLAPLTIEFREYTKTMKPFHIKEVISRDYE